MAAAGDKIGPAIRLAIPSDAKAILKIYSPFVESSAVSFEYDIPTEQEIKRRIKLAMQRHVWLVLEWDGVVVGFAYASDFRSRKAYQWIAEVSVYVREQFQRRKIAHALYVALHQILKIQGFHSAKAVMTAPNPASHQFHVAFGYKSEACFKQIGYKFNEWYDIECMHLPLNEGAVLSETIPIQEIQSEIIDEICLNAATEIVQ